MIIIIIPSFLLSLHYIRTVQIIFLRPKNYGTLYSPDKLLLILQL